MTTRTLCPRLVLALLALVPSASLGQAQSPYGTLTRLADKAGTDKGSSFHHYTDVYELFLMPMRTGARKVLEIGVAGGASLAMWRDFFPNATIHGIDIQDTSRFNSRRVRTFVADQGKRDQLAAFLKASGGDFDLILDDGGHTMPLQQISLGFLFPQVRPGGYYVVEDVHTSLAAPGWGIDPDKQNTTLAMIENFVRTGQIRSKYMTADEARYLAEHIQHSTFLRADQRSMSWIVRKK